MNKCLIYIFFILFSFSSLTSCEEKSKQKNHIQSSSVTKEIIEEKEIQSEKPAQSKYLSFAGGIGVVLAQNVDDFEFPDISERDDIKEAHLYNIYKGDISNLSYSKSVTELFLDNCHIDSLKIEKKCENVTDMKLSNLELNRLDFFTFFPNLQFLSFLSGIDIKEIPDFSNNKEVYLFVTQEEYDSNLLNYEKMMALYPNVKVSVMEEGEL